MNVLFIKNMMKANLNPSALKVLALTCSLFFFTSAQAAKEDLEQEITIKSQRQSADLKNKIASYLDNVSIQQGSISITADIVKVFSSIDKNTGEKTDTYLAKGNPAVFQQQLEDGNLFKLQERTDKETFLTPQHTSSQISINKN